MNFQVPDDTTINTNEFKPDSYVIPFAPELITFITDNLKVTTYRFGKKYNYLKVGDKVAIQNSTTQEIVANTKIKAKSQTTFKDLPLSNGMHEGYKDKNHQKQVFSGYYAYLNRPIDDNDEFLVFVFELI